jgi:hypothetical protein
VHCHPATPLACQVRGGGRGSTERQAQPRFCARSTWSRPGRVSVTY